VSGTGGRPWRVPAAIAAIITGLTIEDRLNTALGAMHRAGDVSAGFGSVASPSTLWSAQSTKEMVRAWRDWNADRLAAGLGGRFIGPNSALVGYALVDALLVVLPVAALLGLAARSATRRIGTRPNPDPTVDAALRRVAELSGLAVLVYLGLGLLVNAATPLVVYLSATALLPWLGLATLLTWVALAWAVLPLAFAEVVALRQLIVAQERGWLSERLRVWAGYLLALRAQLVAAALVAVLVTALRGDIGLQIDDVAMRWLDYWPAGILAAVAAGFASWLILLSGEVCWYRHWRARLPAPDPGTRIRLLVLGVLGLAVAAAGLVIVELAHLSFGAVLVWPGAALLLFSALSLPEKILAVRPRPTPAGPPPTIPVQPITPAQPAEPGETVVPGAATAAAGPPLLLWIAGAVPLGALGVITARAATTLFVTQELRAFWLVAVGLAALTLATLMIIARVPSLPARVEAGSALWFAAGLTVAAGLATAVWPIVVGQAVGAIALLFLIVAALTVVISALSLLGEAWTPAGALALLGLRRMPVITFVVVWFVVTSAVDQTDHYHDVRLAGARPPTAAPVTADTALHAWLDHHRPSEPPEPGGSGTRRTVPMVFVSASGGGIRSAYWTAMVLDCLFDAHPVQRECTSDHPLDRSDVFAESGISGGSVGFAFDRVLAGSGRSWADALSADFVSPDVAALGFRDIPNSFLRWEPSGIDRAAVLEKAWEQAAGGDRLRTGLFADSRGADGQLRFPLLMLSGATVDDACQLNTSVLLAAPRPAQGPQPPLGTTDCLSLTPFEPGRAHDPGIPDGSALAATKDLADFSCAPGSQTPQDVALSTAALLSARFPYISPTGGLSSCDDPQRRTFDIDGGLIDSSGLSAIGDLWAHLAGDVQAINDDPDDPICIQPRLLMIDNGYLPAAPVAAPSQPEELLAPIQGRSRATGQRSAEDEQAAALAFDHAFGAATCAGVTNLPATPASRVAHVVPTSQPGIQAPLGWTLSRFARDDLEEQLNSPANRCEIQLVRSWFRNDPNAQTGFCVTGFAVRHANSPQTGPTTVSTLPVTTSEDVGVAGVRVTADGCVQAPLTACSVTTDAAGRFDLLLIPGQQQTLHVDYGGVTRTGVPIPVSPGFVNTTINILVTGPVFGG
jgi:hypothetical protein